MFKIRREQIDAMAGEPRQFLDLVQAVAARNGQRTEVDRDGKGLAVRESDDDHGTTRYRMNNKGLPGTVQAPDGRTFHYTYDQKNRPNAVSDAAGNRTLFEFNEEDEVVAVTDPGGYRQRISHRSGEPVAVERPGASGLRFGYDHTGQVNTVTDGRNRTLGIERDLEGRIRRILERGGGTIAYDHDDKGRLSALTTPIGAKWRVEYDNERGEKIVVYPDGRQERYGFDHRGLTRVVRRDGGTVSLATRPDGRLSEAAYPGGIHVRLKHDDDGHVTLGDNGAHPVAFGYDNEGRRVLEKLDGRSVQVLFDNSGLIDRMVTHRGETVHFKHGPDQRVSRVTDWDGRVYDVRRDGSGFLTGIDFPNGVRFTRQTSALGLAQTDRLRTRTSEITRDYRYDQNDRLVGVEDSDLGTKEHSFDADDRLTGVHSPRAATVYSYDAHGNATRVGDQSFRYNGLDQIAPGSGVNCRYDALGNLTEESGLGRQHTYTYNGQNQLVRANLPGGRVAEYGYDAFGRRVWKRVDGVTTIYSWWGEQIIAEDTDGPEARHVDYLYLPGTNLPLAMRVNSEVYCVHADHLDTPVRLTNRTGDVVGYAEPHGFTFVEVQADVRQPLRFPGQYFDEETGLHYNVARYFHPGLSRYLSPDPLFFEGSTNLYLYALNNPVAFTDPTGRFAPLVIAGIIGGAVLVGAAICAALAAAHQAASNYAEGRPLGEGVLGAAGRGAIGGAGAGLGAGVGFVLGGPWGALAGGLIGGLATSVIMAGVEAPSGHTLQACGEAAINTMIPFRGSIKRYLDNPNDPNRGKQLAVDMTFDVINLALIALGVRAARGARVPGRPPVERPVEPPKPPEKPQPPEPVIQPKSFYDSLSPKAKAAYDQQKALGNEKMLNQIEEGTKNADGSYDVAKANKILESKHLDEAGLNNAKQAKEQKATQNADKLIKEVDNIVKETDGTNRPNAKIGDGTSEAALMAEIADGEPKGSPEGHYQKVADYTQVLKKKQAALQEQRKNISDPAKQAEIDQSIKDAQDRIDKMQPAIDAWNDRATTNPAKWNPDGTSKKNPNWPKDLGKK